MLAQGIFLFMVLVSPDRTGTYPVAEYRDYESCRVAVQNLRKDLIKGYDFPEGYSADFACSQGVLP